MEKKKITFKERLNAFLVYWKENWKRDCLYGFLCLALGFCIARCTLVEGNSASADEINFEDDYAITLFELSNVSHTENVYQFVSSYSELVYIPDFPSSIKVIGSTKYNIFKDSTGRFSVSTVSGSSIRSWFTWDNFINNGPIFSFREFSGLSLNRSLIYEITSTTPISMYRVVYYKLPSSTSNLFDVFNGATVTYEIGHYDDTAHHNVTDKNFTTHIPVSAGVSSFDFSFLYNSFPEDIKRFDFTLRDYYEHLIIKSRSGSALDISKLNIIGLVYEYTPTLATIDYGSNLSLSDGFVLSYFGHFSLTTLAGEIETHNPEFPFYSNYNLTLISSQSSGFVLRDRLNGVIVSYGDTYENGYSNGYEVGYNFGLSVSNTDYNAAYNSGYNIAYNTVDTLSPNYVAGYNAGLSNANGSWVLSPINAINTIFNLELFVIGNFHFKLSYLVYLSIGGLLVGVLIRFLFHS